MNKTMIYPAFYWCRGKQSDKQWIFERMGDIPDNKKQDVATHYENIYLAERSPWIARRKANEYLHGIAHEYRVNR